MSAPLDLNAIAKVTNGAAAPMDPMMMLIMQMMQGGGGGQQQGPDFASIFGAMNTPSQMEQQRMDWTGAQMPSYTGAPTNPFNSGFFKSGASQMAPEARLASEGPSAMNQWAMQGAVPGIDQSMLGAFNNTSAQNFWPMMGAPTAAVPPSPKKKKMAMPSPSFSFAGMR